VRHTWKIVGGAAAILVVVIAAVPLFVNVNTFRPLLEQQLTTALGRKVVLGKLSLSVFSGSVTARDLSVADDPQFSSTPFLTAKALRIGVEMRPLLFERRLLVRSLEVDAPKIHLMHAANGIWNFSTIGQTAASRTSNTQQESILPNLTVDQFSVKNGNVTVDSLPAQGPSLVYSQVELSVQGFSFAKQFPYTLKANLPGDGTVAVAGKAGPIDAHNAANTAFDAQVTLRHLDPVAAGFLDKSAGLTLLADADAHAASDGKSVDSNGTVHAQRLQLRPDAVPAPKPIDITYHVIHNLQDSTGQLQDAAAQTGKVALHLSGTYALTPGSASVKMTLVGQGLPIDELQSLLPAAGVTLPSGSALQGGTLTTNMNISGPLDHLTISGPVALDNTRLTGFNASSQLKGLLGAVTDGNVTTIRTFRANLAMNEGAVQANNLYLSLPAIGEATGSGTVSAAKALNFRLSLKLDTNSGIGGKAVGILSMVSGIGGKVASQAAANGVPVIITGTAANPVITPNMRGLVSGNASSVLGNQKGSGQKVLNSLGGLFGGAKKR